MTDIHHRIGVESPSTDGVYAALTTIDGLSGWWTTRHHRRSRPRRQDRVPVPARAASTWRSSSSCRASGPLAGRRRAARVDRHHHRLAALPQRRVHDRAVHATRAGPSRSSSCTTAARSGPSYLLSLKALVETGTGVALARRRARSATGTERT